MTTAEHRHVREQLGAWALGDLGPEEAVAVLAHLDACASCRDELAELRATADALAAADPAVLAAPHPPPWLAERVVGAVAASRARRSRTRRAAAAAGALAAAAVVVVLGAVVGPRLLDDDTPAPLGGDGAVALALDLVPDGVEATAAVEVRPWGTTVHLEATGLRTGQVYSAWLEQADGSRVSAGTFRPGAERSIRCYLTAAITPGEATAFGLSTDGVTLLRAELT